MKKVVLFGASGRTGKYIIRELGKLDGVELTLFVRDSGRLSEEEKKGVRIVCGDALIPADVERAMAGQDILLCSLEGDVLAMAKNIKAALAGLSVRRIVWLTGMGIHDEITGPRRRELRRYAMQRPEYIQAADLIASSDASTTLLRCPLILDGDDDEYFLTEEGEQPAERPVSRTAIAKCLSDIVMDETLGAGLSLAITN